MRLTAHGWRRQWQPTPVLLPGKSHGRRSLVGCRLWSCQELDTTERLYFHFSLSCIGEGNGNALQYSCLENPRDGGVWWASIYGVAQSQTRLKQHSSSSSSSCCCSWLPRDGTHYSLYSVVTLYLGQTFFGVEWIPTFRDKIKKDIFFKFLSILLDQNLG